MKEKLITELKQIIIINKYDLKNNYYMIYI